MSGQSSQRNFRFQGGLVVGAIVVVACTMIALVDHLLWGQDILLAVAFIVGGLGGLILGTIIWKIRVFASSKESEYNAA